MKVTEVSRKSKRTKKTVSKQRTIAITSTSPRTSKHGNRRLPCLMLQLVLLAESISTSESTILPPPKRIGFGKSLMGRSSAFDQYATKIFEEADENSDGTISLSECYELVLKMYIKVNRQAAIPPPTRPTVLKIFQESDNNHNRRISRDEFNNLAKILARRVSLSLVAHSMISYLAAPAAAEYIVRVYSGKKWLLRMAKSVLPPKIEPLVTTRAFWRTVLVMTFVSTLGNFILENVYWYLDWWNYNPRPRIKKMFGKDKKTFQIEMPWSRKRRQR